MAVLTLKISISTLKASVYSCLLFVLCSLLIGVTRLFPGENAAQEVCLCRLCLGLLPPALPFPPPVVELEADCSPCFRFLTALFVFSGCIPFSLFTAEFIALCWLLYFYFPDLPKMHLDFGIFRLLKPCTLLLMVSFILENFIWMQIYFSRLCFSSFFHH